MKFGAHRLMIRPRDGHDMRILGSSLVVTPRADVHWAFDTFGNSVALLTFRETADELVIASELELRRYGLDAPAPRIERHAGAYPFRYDAEDAIDLAPLVPLLFPDDRAAVEGWIGTVIPSMPAGSFQVLDALGSAVHRAFRYSRRLEYGVQSPAETIATASGTCRDFAVLFMEAARTLGFAARFVTGYLYDASTDPAGTDPAGDETASDETVTDEAVAGGGSTHAWADVFVPGAGWVEFDPTNRIVAGRDLIRVATTRAPAQAVPVSGTYSHDEASFLGMDVEVAVTRLDRGDHRLRTLS